MPPKKEPEVKVSFFAHPDPFVEIIFIIFSILVAIYLINGIISLFTVESLSSVWLTNIMWRVIDFFILHFWIFQILSMVISATCILGIVVFLRKLWFMRANAHKLLYPQALPTTMDVNPEWQRILDHIESTNENDWRQAIMEADIMLSGILDKMNLPGETIGDKLKAVDRSDFRTIQNAWEAHKIRNQVAHEGAGFILIQREVRRVIGLYRSIFEEFKLI